MRTYKEKSIALGGDRKLINILRKNGFELYNPRGEWNGYGYEKFPLEVLIKSLKEMRLFNKLYKEIKENEKPALSEEEKIEKWIKRLAKLGEISEAEAREIAQEKLEYKQEKIIEMENRQNDRYSTKREKLINKMKRENPLRYIENEGHALAILDASYRHNNTDYEDTLDKGRELAELGYIDKGEVKEYARNNYHRQ